MTPAHKKHPALSFADDLELPLDAVTQTFAFIARRGAGKTYGATKLAEGMLDAGAQVVAIDPVGVWYGLRISADGKGKGIPIPVFGGLHGDVPLEPGAGALIADLIVDRGISAVLDVSMFRKGDRKRFVTDLAEQLFHRKKSARSPLHVFVEEAQVFVPQRVQADEARMLGAFEDIIKLGRNFGIGATLITQRPQAVNKDALNQTECLVVLQTNGAQERKALKDWVVEQGVDVNLLNELPGLKVGVAWLWSPQWLQTLQKVHISKKRTYNASATPEVGKAEHAPRELAPVDLEQIRSAMKDVVTRAEESDPKALRKRIAELEQQLRKVQTSAQTSPAPPPKEVPALKEADIARLEAAVKTTDAIRNNLAQALQVIASETGNLATELEQWKPSSHFLVQHPQAHTAKLYAPYGDKRVERTGPSLPIKSVQRVEAYASEVKLKRGMREMLSALSTRAGDWTTVEQLGVMTGMSTKSGTWSDYLGALRRAGLIESGPQGIRLTDAGAAMPGLPSPPDTHEKMLALWMGRLKKAGVRRILQTLVDVYPKALTREEVGTAVGMSIASGTWSDYLGMLRRAHLIEDTHEGLRASATLFP